MKLLLASASPARRQTLISAGITPLVAVSDVSEESLLADLKTRVHHPSPAEQVQLLATAKARDVAGKFVNQADTDNLHDANIFQNFPDSANPLIPRVVIGCDSMFSFAGEVVGKPHTPEVARNRLQRMRGNVGELYTGHCAIDTLTGAESTGVSCARIHISDMSDSEIEAYIASGEPLGVAGSFTIDGFGGPFVERIAGDHHGVVGISLPLLRKLLGDFGMSIVDFWDIRQA
ncbi:nucleoside triphosphate pyrophosphatase [Arcanobacterium hippocoleae]